MFLFVINISSYFNGIAYKMAIERSVPTYCDESDESCIRVAPYNQSQANDIINMFPVTFYSTTPMITSILSNWSNHQGTHIEILNPQGLVHIEDIDAIGFVRDILIQMKECNFNNGYISIYTHAYLRVGYKDYKKDLKNIIKSIYSELDKNFDLYDKIYEFC